MSASATYRTVSALFLRRQHLLFDRDVAVRHSEWNGADRIDQVIRQCETRIVALELALSQEQLGCAAMAEAARGNRSRDRWERAGAPDETNAASVSATEAPGNTLENS